MAKHRKKHSEHLCVVVAAGKGRNTACELATEVRYVCAKCGAAARKKKKLCSARRIEQAYPEVRLAAGQQPGKRRE